MDLDVARQRLLKRREELRGRELQANAKLRTPPDLTTTDFADDAAIRQRNSVLTALSRNADQELQQVEDALLRIGEGEYGTCVVCGRPIEEERLEAVPHTDRCIRHAERGGARPSG